MNRCSPQSAHPLKDQSNTPLVDTLQRCATRQNAAFHTPGHKRGQQITARQHQLFGRNAFRADLPELPDLDNLFAPEGVILEAQKLAAEAFGAEQTYFLANGSTCGIEAAILAVCNPGDKIVVPRNAHISAISGLILSGAVPIYIAPDYNQQWHIPLAVSPKSIQSALQQHPDTKAVLVVSPTYHGVCSDLEAIAHLAHQHNIPLIVDEAHGPHFAFHPDLPKSAMASGADIAIGSTHKTLSAFTQAAMLHTQGVGGSSCSETRINQSRLSKSLQLTQSTSPSYLLLGSLDAARHQMATVGQTLLEQTIELADDAVYRLSQISELDVLQPQDRAKATTNNISGDRTRITVDVSKLNITGFEADEIFHKQHQVTAELPSLNALTFIISIGNTSEDIDRLVHGFKQLCQSRSVPLNHSISNSQRSNQDKQPFDDLRLTQSTMTQSTINSRTACSSISPRQAFFAQHQSRTLHQAIGKISAETICPYPPGIPTILPGEVITESALLNLQATLKAGGIITGCSDPTLKTVLVVKSIGG